MQFTSFLRKSVLIGATVPLAIVAYSEQLKLPLTPDEVKAFVQNAEDQIDQEVKTIVTLPDNQKTHQHVMGPWNRLGIDILGNLSVLSFLSENDLPSKEAAANALPELVGYLFKSLVLNPAPYHAFMQYAEYSLADTGKLSPYACYEIHCLLESCEAIRYSLSKTDQESLNRLKAICAQQEKQPFLYLKGDASQKASSKKELSLFCLNTCFLPGDVAGYIYGGVDPWKKRLPILAEKILAADADLVCLQEMHGLEACQALYELLKDKYAEFYISIGPRVLGFSFQTLGLPSGLFVASKYPIDNPRFTLFPKSGLQMNYGFFDGLVKNGAGPIAHIYTTHLQSMNKDKFPEIREQQLIHILETMEKDFQENADLEIPYFLCGDLNIPFGSGEPAEAIIRTYYYDAYNRNRVDVAPSESTCTEHFTQAYLSSISDLPATPNYEILDYALLLKTLPSCLCRTFDTKYVMETSLLPMNDLSSPSTAISDHHALFTSIRENPAL